MKIIVVSDTHIIDPAEDLPEKFLAQARDADMIIHAGDLVDLAVLERLKKICPRVKAVCGNMDSVKARERLPPKEVFSAGRFRIGIIHGLGAPDQLLDWVAEAFRKEKLDLIVFGHSHQATLLKKDGIVYFNPGSLTDKAFSPYNSFGIIQINDRIEARIIKL